MAINFPNNPSNGNTYAYNSIIWSWNGAAWDRQTTAGGGSGATGATGSNGTNGITGATGATGATGTNGTNGATGATGSNGTNGATGATGPVGDYVVSFNGNTGALQGVSSFNGVTGAITFFNYVASFNGRTGAVQGVSAAVAGTGISVSGATGSVTITNTGVQSFNGLTGALQGVSAAVAGTGISVSGATGSVTITNTGVQSFNGITGAVAGITAGGANTFTALNTFSAGISASGATFSGNIRLQNAEYIQNTTNGRIDFIPGPSSGTTYGLYMDFTNWSGGANGVQFGTINSSTNVLDGGAGILYASPLVLANAKQFSFGSSQRYSFAQNSSTNSTLQLGVPAGVASESAALSIIDYAWFGNGNRIPATAHTNPNLYLYRAGAASANDFIRIEHDGTYGNIVSGGTSGILMRPGSGVLGISGGISLSAGITFTDGTYQTSKTPDFLLFSMGII